MISAKFFRWETADIYSRRDTYIYVYAKLRRAVRDQRNPRRARIDEPAWIEWNKRENAVVTCRDESESWFPVGAIFELTAPQE